MTSLTDIAAILATWSSDPAHNRRAALATVVDVKGSAYRRPGARMLVTASDRTAGMISGGCLEEDVREHARAVIAAGEPRLVAYDNTSPADIVFGLGLGCNGVVQVLVEPIEPGAANNPLTFLAVCHDRRKAGRIVTVFAAGASVPSVPLGTRLLVWPDGNMTANFENDASLSTTLQRALADTAGRRAAIRRVAWKNGGELGVLIETIAPPTSLVVFGAGDDAIPLVHTAKQLGWHVTVTDSRPAYATMERFPTADAVICVRAEALAEHPLVPLGPQTIGMIMTHNFGQDKALLRTILPRRWHYVGILGPRARTQRLLDELAAEGAVFTPELFARVHGPAGLDIGAETPEEIAVSIIAEMRAVLGKREGGALRLRTGGIHEPVDAATLV